MIVYQARRGARYTVEACQTERCRFKCTGQLRNDRDLNSIVVRYGHHSQLNRVSLFNHYYDAEREEWKIFG